MMPERCKRCLYYFVEGNLCDYASTGRTRTRRTEQGGRYCEPPEKCTFYAPRDGSKNRPMYVNMEQGRDKDRIGRRDAAMLQLYEEGYSDAKIAAELSCGPETVRRWRSKAGLPTQKERQEGLKANEETQRPQ